MRAWLLVLLAWPGAAAAATLQGRVDVQLEVKPAAPRPDVAALGEAGPRATPDRRRSVVYLESAPRGAFESAPPGRARLDQRDEAFHPYVLPVLAGTTVDFPNSDRTFHNVFSLSKTRRFDLGRYGRGASKSVRFDTPGVVRVFCDIHAHMSAYILVFAHTFFASTDADGRYRIPGVPPGEYGVSVWSDGSVRETRRVTVPEGETEVSQDFVVR